MTLKNQILLSKWLYFEYAYTKKLVYANRMILYVLYCRFISEISTEVCSKFKVRRRTLYACLTYVKRCTFDAAEYNRKPT